ncbi:MAG: lysophospholipid acyltransferase family protein [Leptospiraceae bacterium]|nr:lysophospholipid acyltransferase family protein [Leptospiraceae bacterium]
MSQKKVGSSDNSGKASLSKDSANQTRQIGPGDSVQLNASEKPAAPTFKQKLKVWFLPIIVVNLQRLWGLTWRRIDIGRQSFDEIRKEGAAWIYGIWHTNVLFSPYLNRGLKANVMISDSRDGEMITKVVKKFGNFAIRGSTSKGGMRALKNCVSALKKGQPAAITPDGPRGPAFQVQDGIIVAAMMSGRPIIPFHYEGVRQWIAEKAWDKHRVPKPFTRVVVSYGEPIFVPSRLSEEQFAAQRDIVQTAMMQNMEKCQKHIAELVRK